MEWGALHVPLISAGALGRSLRRTGTSRAAPTQDTWLVGQAAAGRIRVSHSGEGLPLHGDVQPELLKPVCNPDLLETVAGNQRYNRF